MRIVAAGFGVACILACAFWLMNFASAGFPDGFLTPYDRLTLMPRTALVYGLLFMGLMFLVRSALGRLGAPDIAGAALAVLFCLALPAIEHCPRWPSCTSLFEATTGQSMDDGIGG